MKTRNSKKYLILLIAFILIAFSILGCGKEDEKPAQPEKSRIDVAGGVLVRYRIVRDKIPSSEEISNIIDMLQMKVLDYSTEAVVLKESADVIRVEIPGINNDNRLVEELVNTINASELYFISQKGPDGTDNYSFDIKDGLTSYELNRSIDELIANGSIIISNGDVAAAKATVVQDNLNNKLYPVSIELTKEGADKFAKATEAAAENAETIAIYCDGKIISAPNVVAKITDGKVQISGIFTYEEADKLAAAIRMGKTKTDFECIEYCWKKGEH